MAPQEQQQQQQQTEQKNAVDVSTDVCARSCGFFMVAMAIAGATLACLAFFSCEFLIVTVPVVTNATNSTPPTTPSTGEIISNSVGSSSNSGFLNGGGGLRFLDQTVLLPGLGAGDDDLFQSNETATTSRPTVVARPTAPPTFSPTPAPPTSISLGVVRYFDEGTQTCLYYSVPGNQLGVHYRVSRIGAAVMTIGALLATLVLLLEYCFFRFYCARTMVAFGCVSVFLGMATFFVIFFDSRCRPQDNQPNNCSRGHGANQAFAASAFYLAVLIMLCFTPKAVPMIRMMDQMNFEQFDNMGWCQCWFKPFHRLHRWRRRHNKDADATITPEEEEEEMLELIHNEEGHVFKQYHDEKAGLTFQNQYTAAYKRWLEFEADYETTLSKFKEECDEAAVDWRTFLRRARMRQQRGDGGTTNFEDETAGTSTSTDNNNYNNQEEEYLDEELLRFVGVLNTLRSNCDFAKRVMERIQMDINDKTKTEDEIKRRHEEKQKNELKTKNSQESLPGKSKGTPKSKKKGEKSLSAAEEGGGESSSGNRSFTFNSEIPMSPTTYQDSDVFVSARTSLRNGDLFRATRVNVAQDEFSTGVNPSVVSNHGRIEEADEEDEVAFSRKQRRPVADFMLGVTGIGWVMNKVKRDDKDKDNDRDDGDKDSDDEFSVVMST